MSCQVVAPAEIPHADAALEGLLPSVDPDVPCQFIRPGEPSITRLNGASVRSLVRWGLTWAVGVFPHSAWLDELRLITVVIDSLEILGNSLCSKGLDGGQGGEGRLVGSVFYSLEGFLIRRHHTDISLLLWKQVVWDHWHLETGLGHRVGRGWILDRSS